MSLTPGTFRPEEIDSPEDPIRAGDLAQAYAAARALEQAMPADPMRPSSDFTTRVIVAIAAEPTPRAAGFLAGVFARPGLASLIGSLRAAWSTAGSASGRPFGVRAAALAYVLVVLLAAVSLTGVAALGTAGAFGLLSRDGSSTPSGFVASPSPSPSPSPSDVAEPSSSPDPSESVEPSESPGPDDSLAPGATPDGASSAPDSSPSPGASDDKGGSPTPGASDDSGGKASGSPTDTPTPSETPP